MSGKSNRRRWGLRAVAQLRWVAWRTAFRAEHGREPTWLDMLKHAFPAERIHRWMFGESQLMAHIRRDEAFRERAREQQAQAKEVKAP